MHKVPMLPESHTGVYLQWGVGGWAWRAGHGGGAGRWKRRAVEEPSHKRLSSLAFALGGWDGVHGVLHGPSFTSHLFLGQEPLLFRFCMSEGRVSLYGCIYMSREAVICCDFSNNTLDTPGLN